MLTTALHPDFGAQIDGIDLRGGETEFVWTLADWHRLDAGQKARARDAVPQHRFSHSRAWTDPELVRQPQIAK